MSKFNLNPMADWGYVNNSRFRFLSIRNQGGGDSPVPPEPVFPTDRILYTVIEGGTQPTSTWITENCSDNVFDESTGKGYLLLNEGVTELTEYYDEEAGIDYTIFIDIDWNEIDGDTNILSVTIPTQITSIGNYTFASYYNLESVIISDSIISIGEGAFGWCYSLINITCNATIPPELNSRSDVFADVPATNCIVPVGSEEAYFDSNWIEYFKTFNGQRPPSIEIHYTATEIIRSYWIDENCLDNVFDENTGEGILYTTSENIGNYAFEGCDSLTSITIPDSIISIGNHAFSYCSNLISIIIPDSIISIGNSAFGYCNSLTSLVVNSGNSKYDSRNNCNAIIETETDTLIVGCKNTIIPNSVTSIDNYAFYGCISLMSIVIPDSVTSIGDYAFYNCNNLTSLIIGNSVITVSSYSFYGCSSLTSLVVNSGNSKYDSRNNCNAIIETETDTLIVGCKNTIIPNSVTSIDNYAFYGCDSLTTITIPDSINSIGDYAFYNCSNLTTVNFNATNCSIMGSFNYPVFTNCNELSILNIGENVTTIPDNAFKYCNSLISITIPDSVTSIGKNVFSGTGWLNNQPNGILYLDNWCIGYKGNKPVGDLIIITGTKGIADEAFFSCTGLTSITIPDSVTNIGNYVFYGCTGLTTVNFNAINCITMGSLSYPVFTNCNALSTLNISENVTNIPDRAFYGCSNLIEVTCQRETPPTLGTDNFAASNDTLYVPVESVSTYESDANWSVAFAHIERIPIVIKYQLTPGSRGLTGNWLTNNTNVNKNTYDSSTGKGTLYLNDNVTSIGSGQSTSYSPFYNRTDVISIDLSNSELIYIDSYAFRGCSSLTEFTVPNSVTSIGNSAFNGCSALTSITVPNSVISIGDSAFYNCSSLTEFTVPNSVTSIAGSPFKQCTGLASIEVASGNSKYDSRNNCNAIIETETDTLIVGCKNTIIPDSTTVIGNHAFYGCSGLIGDLIIPNSVTSIGNVAFERCSGLTSITLPEHITNIGIEAFSDCSGLTGDLIIPNSITTIREISFRGCSSLTGVSIPSSVTQIEQFAFSGCSSLTELTIPDSVEKIYNGAFKDCTNLTKVTCQRVEPPTMYSNNFSAENDTLYVPSESVQSYLDNSSWNDAFNGNIQPIQE